MDIRIIKNEKGKYIVEFKTKFGWEVFTKPAFKNSEIHTSTGVMPYWEFKTVSKSHNSEEDALEWVKRQDSGIEVYSKPPFSIMQFLAVTRSDVPYHYVVYKKGKILMKKDRFFQRDRNAVVYCYGSLEEAIKIVNKFAGNDNPEEPTITYHKI